jgi:hypothetical protein
MKQASPGYRADTGMKQASPGYRAARGGDKLVLGRE